MTAILERIIRKRGSDLEKSLIQLLESDDPTDRATFWRLMGKRVASVDAESATAGGLTIMVVTGVPASSVTGGSPGALPGAVIDAAVVQPTLPVAVDPPSSSSAPLLRLSSVRSAVAPSEGAPTAEHPVK